MDDLLLEQSGFEPVTEPGSAAACAGIALAVCALLILSIA